MVKQLFHRDIKVSASLNVLPVGLFGKNVSHSLQLWCHECHLVSCFVQSAAESAAEQ